MCLIRSMLFVVLLTASSAYADDVDRVRQLRSNDTILPLSKILVSIEKQYPGSLLDVELEEEHGQILYEIRLLGRDHAVHEIKVDARSGDIVDVERD
ncbi:MAG: PepSY domain-containing protein [Mariprofundus sp.]|nr:PepSY domain-containing protein [Mariprofundus sp.]